jgi:hypothetical protein
MTTNFSWTQITDPELCKAERTRAKAYIRLVREGQSRRRRLILVDEAWVHMALTSRNYAFWTTPFGIAAVYFYFVDDDGDTVQYQFHYLPIFATPAARELFQPYYAPRD